MDNNPLSVPKQTGKKVRKATTTIFEIIPGPNHMIITGAKAMIGTVVAATTYGKNVNRILLHSAKIVPLTNPITTPIKYPAKASTMVTQAFLARIG